MHWTWTSNQPFMPLFSCSWTTWWKPQIQDCGICQTGSFLLSNVPFAEWSWVIWGGWFQILFVPTLMRQSQMRKDIETAAVYLRKHSCWSRLKLHSRANYAHSPCWKIQAAPPNKIKQGRPWSHLFWFLVFSHDFTNSHHVALCDGPMLVVSRSFHTASQWGIPVDYVHVIRGGWWKQLGQDGPSW